MHGEDDQRPDHGSDNIPQRNRYAIEGREKSEYAEKKTPNNSAGQTYSYVPRKAKASALPGHHKANKAAANQPNDDPNDDLVECRHLSTLYSSSDDVFTFSSYKVKPTIIGPSTVKRTLAIA